MYERDLSTLHLQLYSDVTCRVVGKLVMPDSGFSVILYIWDGTELQSPMVSKSIDFFEKSDIQVIDPLPESSILEVCLLLTESYL